MNQWAFGHSARSFRAERPTCGRPRRRAKGWRPKIRRSKPFKRTATKPKGQMGQSDPRSDRTTKTQCGPRTRRSWCSHCGHCAGSTCRGQHRPKLRQRDTGSSSGECGATRRQLPKGAQGRERVATCVHFDNQIRSIGGQPFQSMPLSKTTQPKICACKVEVGTIIPMRSRSEALQSLSLLSILIGNKI